MGAFPARDEDEEDSAGAPSSLVHSVVMASEIIDALPAAVVGTVAMVGTTPQIDASPGSRQLELVRGCAKAMSVKLHSKTYEASDVPVPPEFTLA